MSLASRLGSLAVLTAGLTVGSANAALYDNFNSGDLNLSKWSEVLATDSSSNLTDEHEIRNGVYHTAKLTPSDSGTALVFNRQFIPGEFIDYDVNYLSGEGNRIHTVYLNGNFTSSSLFGFWNTIEDGGVGNDFGNYHVKINFTDSGIIPFITRPNGEIVEHNLIGGSSQDYSFGVVTRTGHNGTVHLDYDNFYVNGIPEPSLLVGSLASLALLRRKE